METNNEDTTYKEKEYLTSLTTNYNKGVIDSFFEMMISFLEDLDKNGKSVQDSIKELKEIKENAKV